MATCREYERCFFDYVDGELSEELRNAYITHMEGCRFCQSRKQDHRTYQFLWGELLGPIGPSEAIDRRFHGRLKRLQHREEHTAEVGPDDFVLLEKVALALENIDLETLLDGESPPALRIMGQTYLRSDFVESLLERFGANMGWSKSLD